jgi:ATP-dependent Lon protease
MVDRVPDEVPRILRMNLGDPGRFADLAATLCNLTLPDRDAVLQELDVARSAPPVLDFSLEAAWTRAREVGTGPRRSGAGSPRRRPRRDRTSELRRRIQAIQAELGEVDPLEREADEMLRKLEMARLPARVAAAARPEAERLRSSSTSAREAPPRSAPTWRRCRRHPLDPPRRGRRHRPAGRGGGLRGEHLGMRESKQRLLEVLAVAELRGDLRGPFPCLVGPPGVGKRTLAAAVARGLGRPLVRLELGGRGEADLFGAAAPAADARSGR